MDVKVILVDRKSTHCVALIVLLLLSNTHNTLASKLTIILFAPDWWLQEMLPTKICWLVSFHGAWGESLIILFLLYRLQTKRLTYSSFIAVPKRSFREYIHGYRLSMIG